MSDPIREALEAAAWGECRARAQVNECEDRRCSIPEPCLWCSRGAAAAIAAFMRAWPDSNATHLLIPSHLAAAVERAAKEATAAPPSETGR